MESIVATANRVERKRYISGSEIDQPHVAVQQIHVIFSKKLSHFSFPSSGQTAGVSHTVSSISSRPLKEFLLFHPHNRVGRFGCLL